METALILGGVIVSLLVQFIKSKTSLNAAGVMLVVAILSLVGGLGYQVLLHFGYWEAFVQVLVSAGAFYAFIIKNVKDASTSADRETI